MQLTLERCIIRSLEEEDAESIARHANNRKIWLNLRDIFPYPYHLEDAKAFLHMVKEQDPERDFAIAVNGEAVGVIGVILKEDVERVSAEIGYWLGEDFWGRGIATEALTALTEYAMRTFDLTRLYAAPYARNAASCRVLEKAGYLLEGRLRRSTIKDGEINDQLMYAWVKPE